MTPTDFAYNLSNYLSKYLPGTVGASVNTILSYRDAFAGLINFFESEMGMAPERLCLDDLSCDNIIRYLEWLEGSRGNTVSTRNNRLAAIHAFARYVMRHAPEKMSLAQEIVSIPLKKIASKVPTYLTVEALAFLLSMPDTATRSGRRDSVLLSTLYDSGARAQELCDITVGDVRLKEPCTIRLTGKGSKTRIVPLMAPTASLLRRYITERGLDVPERSNAPLFPSRSGGKLTRKGVSYILAKYVDGSHVLRPGLLPKTVSPHCLRHSKSMHLLQSGVDLIYIRDILGHSDIKTTEVYARIDSEMKRKALEKAVTGVVSDDMPVWQKDSGLLSWLKSLG